MNGGSELQVLGHMRAILTAVESEVKKREGLTLLALEVLESIARNPERLLTQHSRELGLLGSSGASYTVRQLELSSCVTRAADTYRITPIGRTKLQGGKQAAAAALLKQDRLPVLRGMLASSEFSPF